MSEAFVYRNSFWKASYPILASMAGLFDFLIPSSNPDAEIYNGHRDTKETLDKYLQQKGIRKTL